MLVVRTITQMWTTIHFPAAMRSLSPDTRAKAIEIANRLLEQGQMDKYSVTNESICQARRWARLAQSERDGFMNDSHQYMSPILPM